METKETVSILEKWYENKKVQEAYNIVQNEIESIQKNKPKKVYKINTRNNREKSILRKKTKLLEELRSEGTLKLQEQQKITNENNLLKKFNLYWIDTMQKTGTFSDRLSSIIVYTKNSPLNSVEYLYKLLDQQKKNRHAATKILLDLQDLFSYDLLPNNRYLQNFEDQPWIVSYIYHHSDIKTSILKKDSIFINKPLPEYLAYWIFEDAIKKIYLQYIQYFELCMQDKILHIRKSFIQISFMLLQNIPENEKLLIHILVNKLGDTETNIINFIKYRQQELMNKNDLLCKCILDNIQDLIFRPNIKQQAQHIALTICNTIPLYKNKEIQTQLLSIYFKLFKCLLNTMYNINFDNTVSNDKKLHIKNKEKQLIIETKRKLQIMVQYGIHRCLRKENIVLNIEEYISLNEYIEALNILANKSQHHIENTNLVIYSQCILFEQLFLKDSNNNPKQDKINIKYDLKDIYYKLQDKTQKVYHFTKSSCLRVYINQLYRTLKYNNDIKVKENIIRGLLQLSLYSSPIFICSILLIISEINMQNNSSTKISNLWEQNQQIQNYHPTVKYFATCILNEQPILYRGDPLKDYSQMIFQDRFIDKNPKFVNKDSKTINNTYIIPSMFYIDNKFPKLNTNNIYPEFYYQYIYDQFINEIANYKQDLIKNNKSKIFDDPKFNDIDKDVIDNDTKKEQYNINDNEYEQIISKEPTIAEIINSLKEYDVGTINTDEYYTQDEDGQNYDIINNEDENEDEDGQNYDIINNEYENEDEDGQNYDIINNEDENEDEDGQNYDIINNEYENEDEDDWNYDIINDEYEDEDNQYPNTVNKQFEEDYDCNFDIINKDENIRNNKIIDLGVAGMPYSNKKDIDKYFSEALDDASDENDSDDTFAPIEEFSDILEDTIQNESNKYLSKKRKHNDISNQKKRKKKRKSIHRKYT